MAKKKRKTIPKPKTTIAMLQESRNGGQLALRGYSYQFLYSCYLMISAMNEGVVFKLEGIEDIDYTICANDKDTITHIQLKYSTTKQDASFMTSVIRNFLETYLIDKDRRFKLVYDFELSKGNLSKLFEKNLDASSRKYWQNVIEKIKKANILWNWSDYDFDDFISKISFENIEKSTLEASVECALIEKFEITTDNIPLFANGIKMFCLDKIENRGDVTLKEIQECIEAVKFDISKGAQNPAHSWIKRIDFIASNHMLSDYYEGKKATPADIASGLPVSRPILEKELIDSVHNNMITVIKSSSGQGKTSLALKTQFALQLEYTPYQILCCDDGQELGHIVDYFYARTRLGEKPLILLDNLDAHLCKWNKLAQLMQSGVIQNYKLIVTSRENDWYNYSGDLSNLHKLNIVKPVLMEDEAVQIFRMLQNTGYLHPEITDWRNAWAKVADRKLLIEYVYLLTHGEMIEERISAQMKEIGDSAAGGIKFEMLRKVCFADICGVQLPTRKLLKILSPKTECDIGELLKSIQDEFLVHVSQNGDYVEGLHPVRSQHIVNRLHEYYPLVETALDITRIANIQDFPILFAHYPEFKFDKEEFYSNFVDEWWDVKDLKCFLFSVRGTFSGSVMQYFLNNRGAFNEANARGGLFVFATELCPFVRFEEFNESLKTLDGLAEMSPDDANIQYLIELRDSTPKIEIMQTDVYILSLKIYQKLKDINTTEIVDMDSYAMIADWLYHLYSTMNLSSNINLENLWSTSEKYNIDTMSLLMYTSFCGNRERYLGFVESNLPMILTYLKHKTKSHRLYVSDNREEIYVEYVFRVSDIEKGNQESVSRLKVICRTLPIFKTYHSDAIMPHLDALDAYTIPDDAHKEMPIRNLIIMFRQNFASLWLDTIQSNYEFDTVTDWIEHWFNTRECVCRLLEKVCICIYKLLEGRSIGGSGAEFDEKREQYDTYLRGVLSYPKEHRPFEESPDIPKEFSTVQRGYFGSIRNYSNQVVGLIKRDVRMQKLALYNLRRAIAELSSMQDFFGNMSLDQVYKYKHKVLCEQEDQKLIETYMCCEYYTQHQANADFNKYQVKNWYTSMRGKEIDRVNTAFEMIQKEYHAEFPIQIYEDGRFKCYPIILRSFDITDEEAIQDFLFSAAFISEFPCDFLILMWCNDEGEIWPVAFRFSKQCLKAIHGFLISGEQEAVDSLFTPYPIEVTSKMLTCFGSNVKLQSKEKMNPYSRYIGDIGQELWIYSKNRELLSSDEDSEYLTYMLSEVREKISTMLNEVKVHLPSEIYSDLSALCDLTYKGEGFDNMKLNTFVLKYQYM
ncbi:MAG: hypothetical protein OSJ73_21860 [Lachnospiraceae bacterium]|nr:hypothetical protein [Lachnospiraceae bacterium]